jgi:hypothetical protein
MVTGVQTCALPIWLEVWPISRKIFIIKSSFTKLMTGWLLIKYLQLAISMLKLKLSLLVLGLVWSGGLITASALKLIDLAGNRDFFIGVFGGAATGLGLVKAKKDDSSESHSIQTIDLAPIEEIKKEGEFY